MKIGVIGAGAWGKNLVKNLFEMGILGGVAEASETQRETLSAQYEGIPFYATPDELIASDIQAVCIATPAESHFPLAVQAMKAGKDVFVEKPITLSSEDGEALVRMGEELGRIVMVGHLLLYQPAIQFIKKAISDGMIGDVYSYHQERLNHGRARNVENVLWSLGVHDVAVLMFLSGEEPKRITFAGKAGLTRGIEDDSYTHIEFADGATAHIHSSWLWPELRRRLTVIGSKGMLVFDEPNATVHLHRKTVNSAMQNVDEGSEVVFEGSGQPLRIELEHFADCCRNRTTPHSDGVSAVQVLRVMEMADRQKANQSAALINA